MSMISLSNLTFSYPGSYQPVFENCSVTFDTDWRLGLTGRNGRGKTTLLRLLLGSQKKEYGLCDGICLFSDAGKSSRLSCDGSDAGAVSGMRGLENPTGTGTAWDTGGRFMAQF